MATEDTAAFAHKMGDVLTKGSLALSLEVGSRLGIFDHLIKCGKPQTCQEIADGMGLKERYVREWLGAVVCGGVVELADGKYSIPQHRVPVLSSTSPTNEITYTWFMSILGSITDDLIECFKLDGPKGLSYDKFPLFQPWREKVLTATYTEEEVMKSVNEVPGLLAKLEAGMDVCDLGCGTGLTTFTWAKRFPKCQVYGYDISEQGITFAQQKAKDLGVENAHFGLQDGLSMPDDWSDKWDYVHILDVVHDVPESDRFLREIRRILKPGGAVSIVDINMHTEIGDNRAIPYAPMIYNFSMYHCVPVSLEKDGMGLGAAWGMEKAQEMMNAAGFSKVKAKTEEHNFQCYYTCHR